MVTDDDSCTLNTGVPQENLLHAHIIHIIPDRGTSHWRCTILKSHIGPLYVTQLIGVIAFSPSFVFTCRSLYNFVIPKPINRVAAFFRGDGVVSLKHFHVTLPRVRCVHSPYTLAPWRMQSLYYFRNDTRMKSRGHANVRRMTHKRTHHSIARNSISPTKFRQYFLVA